MLLLAHMLSNFSAISKTFFYSSRLHTYLEVAVPMMLPLPLFNSVSLTVRQEKANLRVLKLLLYGRPGPLGLVILVLLLVTWVGGRPGRLPQCLTMEETGGHL